MLVENVKFLAAGELDLVCTAVGLRTLDTLGVLADPCDLSLSESARIVLVQAVRYHLTFVENAIIGV